MDRVCEDFGVICSLDPKPMPGKLWVWYVVIVIKQKDWPALFMVWCVAR